MLAQIQNVDAGFLKQAVMLALGVASGAAAVWGVLGKKTRKIEPMPLQVTEAKEYATIELVEKNSAEITNIWQAMREDKNTQEASARSRSAGIYAKIDSVRAELTGNQDALRRDMTSGFKDIERALGRLEGEIKRSREE